jgi:hypothetical protein
MALLVQHTRVKSAGIKSACVNQRMSLSQRPVIDIQDTYAFCLKEWDYSVHISRPDSPLRRPRVFQGRKNGWSWMKLARGFFVELGCMNAETKKVMGQSYHVWCLLAAAQPGFHTYLRDGMGWWEKKNAEKYLGSGNTGKFSRCVLGDRTNSTHCTWPRLTQVYIAVIIWPYRVDEHLLTRYAHQIKVFLTYT